MKKIKIVILFVLIVVCGKNFRLFGQTAFDCTTSGLILTQGNVPSSGITTFYRINTNANPFNFEILFTIPYIINSTGYNPLDDCLYAFPVSGETGAMTRLLRIDKNGTVTVFTVTAPGTAPGGNGYKGGTIDNNGIFYLSANTSDTRLFYIDLKTLSSAGPYQTKGISLGSANVNLPDIAWNPLDGKIYGVESQTGQLGKVDVITLSGSPATTLTGAVTRIGSGDNTNYAFGALYLGNNGVLYGSLNSGGFYQFNLTTGTKVLISGTPASSTNDGASCPNVPITYGADIQVTKTDNTTLVIPGNTTVYTIVVSNPGPFGAMNVQVSDPLPVGIPAANVRYTASVSGSATTNVSGIQTGAISDVVSLPIGGRVTYTVNLTVPSNYASTTLTNTVTATPDNTSTTDINTLNNSALDINDVKIPFLPVNPHNRGKFGS